MTKKLKAKAAPGRTVPIHALDNPNGGHVLLAPGETMEVFDSTNIRRRVRGGDLIVEKSTTSPSK